MTGRTARKSQVITRRATRRAGGGVVLTAALVAALIAGGLYFHSEQSRLKAEIATLGDQLSRATQELQAADTEKQSLAKELDAFRRNSADWAAEIEKDYAALKLTEVPKLNRLLDRRDADISDLQKRLDAATREAEQAGADYIKRLASLSDALDSEKMLSAAARSETKRLAEAETALQKKLADITAALAARTGERDTARAAAEALRTEITAAEASLADLRSTSEAREAKSRAEIAALKDEIARLQAATGEAAKPAATPDRPVGATGTPAGADAGKP